jgi:hypothetical protein
VDGIAQPVWPETTLEASGFRHRISKARAQTRYGLDLEASPAPSWNLACGRRKSMIDVE